MTTPDLTYIERRNKDGDPSIAPFINDRNVWDIPPQHWTPEIKKALLNAYKIGREQAFNEVLQIVSRNQYIDPATPWTKTR